MSIKHKEHKDRALKAKATIKAKAENYKSQKIKINDEWSVVRIDDLNWQIKYTGKSQSIQRLGTDRWYYGTLRWALAGVFDKALNEGPQQFALGENDLVDIAERIQACIRRLRA